MNKFYRLEWFLEKEGDLKRRLFSNREVAEREYNEVKSALYNGCWISLDEFVEENEEEGFRDEYNQLHFVEL